MARTGSAPPERASGPWSDEAGTSEDGGVTPFQDRTQTEEGRIEDTGEVPVARWPSVSWSEPDPTHRHDQVPTGPRTDPQALLPLADRTAFQVPDETREEGFYESPVDPTQLGPAFDGSDFVDPDVTQAEPAGAFLADVTRVELDREAPDSYAVGPGSEGPGAHGGFASADATQAEDVVGPNTQPGGVCALQFEGTDPFEDGLRPDLRSQDTTRQPSPRLSGWSSALPELDLPSEPRASGSRPAVPSSPSLRAARLIREKGRFAQGAQDRIGPLPPPSLSLPSPPSAEPPRPETSEAPEPSPLRPRPQPRGSTLQRLLRAVGQRSAAPSDPNLHRMVQTTEAAARVIPTVLGGMLLLFSLYVAVVLFGRGGPAPQPHVEFSVLTNSNQQNRATKLSRLSFETEPPQVIVVLDEEILGKTPFEALLKLPDQEQVGIRLHSPYFETWVGEVEKGADGAFQLKARLIPRP